MQLALPIDRLRSVNSRVRSVRVPAAIGTVAGWLSLCGIYAYVVYRWGWLVLRDIERGAIGGSDGPQFLWNNWWSKFALVDLGRSPFSTDYMFHPQTNEGSSFVANYYTLLAVPLQLFFSVSAATNLMVLASFFLTCIGAFLLVRHQTGDAAAAFVCSFMVAFAPTILIRLGNGHHATPALWPTCLAAMAWMAAMWGNRPLLAMAAGLAVGFQASILAYQGSYALVLLGTLTLGARWGFWRDPETRVAVFLRLMRDVAIAGVACSIVMAPTLVQIIANREDWRSVHEPLSNSLAWAPDLFVWFVPTKDHPVLAPIFLEINRKIGGLDHLRSVFPGWIAWFFAIVAMVAALIFKRDRARLAPWIVSFLTFWILSLGPILYINGIRLFPVSNITFNIPLPFILYWHIPFLGHGRLTTQMTYTVSICLAVLAGWALAALFRRLRYRPLAWLVALPLAAGVLWEGQGQPMHVPGYPRSSYLYEIGQETSGRAVLDVPIGWRDGRRGTTGEFRVQYLDYATIHQKPMIGGYFAVVPDRHFDYYNTNPVLNYLFDPAKAPPAATDREAAREALRSLNVGWVLLHPHARQAANAQYFERVVGLTPVHRDQFLIVYRLD